jgi:hypothetical protein
VRGDPALRALAERHRALCTTLRGAFDQAATDAPADLRSMPRLSMPANENGPLARWTVLAATLALGLAVGTLLPGRGSPDSPVRIKGGQMVAAAALDRALDTQLASAGESGPVRIRLSFRGADGRWCRAFDGAEGAGLACRAGDEWRVEGLFPSHGGSGDYRMAAGTDPRLAAMIDTRMSGEAADALAERSARDNGWR